MTVKTLIELLDVYYEKFNDMFPTMCFQTATEKEMKTMVEQCIKENKPAEELFDLDYDDEY